MTYFFFQIKPMSGQEPCKNYACVFVVSFTKKSIHWAQDVSIKTCCHSVLAAWLINIGQWPCNRNDSLVVPTIYKAYFSGLCKGIYQPKNGLIWYLHFRILEFSCIGMSFVPSLWILLVVMSRAACGQWDFRGVLKMQQWPKSQTDITQSTAWWMGILGFLLAQEPVSISSQADKLWQTMTNFKILSSTYVECVLSWFVVSNISYFSIYWK